ncbi:MAG: hypothetical protein ACJ8DI_14965 [Ktedonobacteraceae bacterium]
MEQDARLRVYRLRPEPFVDLQAWLDQVQAFWSDQLEGFKAHVERTQKGGDWLPDEVLQLGHCMRATACPPLPPRACAKGPAG